MQDRRGPGAALFQQNIYVAYTGNGTGDQPVYMAYFGQGNSSQYIQTNFVASGNPALESFGGALYAVVNDASHNVQVLSSNGSTNFAQSWVLPGQYDYSPATASDANNLYIGLRDINDHKLTVCRYNGSYTTSSCTHFPNSNNMIFNPGMVVWNGTLYIAFEDDNGDHTVRYYTSTDGGQTITLQGGASGDQTSTEPRLAVINNTLYMGFRSNDGSHNFLYKYSTDGVNWTSSMQTGLQMESAPSMVSTDANYFDPNRIYTYYGSNDSNHSIVLAIGYGN